MIAPLTSICQIKPWCVGRDPLMTKQSIFITWKSTHSWHKTNRPGETKYINDVLGIHFKFYNTKREWCQNSVSFEILSHHLVIARSQHHHLHQRSSTTGNNNQHQTRKTTMMIMQPKNATPTTKATKHQWQVKRQQETLYPHAAHDWHIIEQQQWHVKNIAATTSK